MTAKLHRRWQKHKNNSLELYAGDCDRIHWFIGTRNKFEKKHRKPSTKQAAKGSS
jgi:hypothetical protein